MLDPQLRRRPLNIPDRILPVLIISITLPAYLLQSRRSFPHALLASQPETQHVATGIALVREAATGVEHGKVVEDLDIAFLERDFHRMFLGQKVDRVQGLGLDFSHGGNIWVMGREVSACKGATGELEAGSMAVKVVKKRAAVVLSMPESGSPYAD